MDNLSLIGILIGWVIGKYMGVILMTLGTITVISLLGIGIKKWSQKI